ncbi:hypothetical protein SAMN04488498_1401 [Mesorhizobium albiziae]|uniref:Uncharacterized protein n=1 Tax=Neomesorhizobium albiziae TaxID=335020 RepID=A0A1I4FB79_9HYPH|nr:DUF6527 family protein [Mesorhizobium albiziae]GLS33072.1 hypothetical protein GCM10007937_47830 [Mesorhizobium albiziae]SFL14560.1 hypothetical protein SAMN04488498_1401 [Mesorhizobium albiziae]
MRRPARKLRWRGVGEYRDEAEGLLEQAGDAAAVIRGRLRSLILKCPDGCGETLSINLDPRVGKAWRLDVRCERLSLYPSVWREGGCKSHFILWRDHIVWCGRFEDENEEPAYHPELEALVLEALDPRIFRTSFEVAVEIDEIIWDVDRVLRRLVREGRAEAGGSASRRLFRRVESKARR